MSSEPQVDEQFRQIPVCRRCRLRKIKCDRGVPKCSNCTKSSSACIIVDPITSEQYPRDYIRRLEDEERQLLAKLETLSPQDPPPIADPPRDDETPRSLTSTVSTARPNGFVGDGSGLRQVKLPVHVAVDHSRHNQTLTIGVQLPPSHLLGCKVAGIQAADPPTPRRATPAS